MPRLAQYRWQAIVRTVVLYALATVLPTSTTFALNPSLEVSQYAHTSWTIRDGFFQGYIETIAQTPDGYLWLGTEFGLLRFDGVRFVPWKSSADVNLPSSFITKLLAARDGSLWIGTLEGLARLKDGRLTDYPELAGYRIHALVEDRAGTVWIGTAGAEEASGRLCSIQSGRVHCYGSDGSLGKGVISLYEDSIGNLWVGTEIGLWRREHGSSELIPVPDLLGQVRALMEGDNDTILIALSREIKRLVDGKSEAYPLPAVGQQFQPGVLLRDRNGSLWIGTVDQGVVHVHQGKMDRFTRADGLSSDAVSSIFEDREGNIWVSTLGGLDRFHDLAVTTISAKQGLSNNYVRSVLAAQDGSVWIGTLNGLNRWNDGQITIYRKHQLQAAPRVASASFEREVIDNGLPGDDVQSLFQDGRGRIWVATREGLAYFENGRFTPVRGVVNRSALSLVENSLENLWISDVNRGLLQLFQGMVVKTVPWTKFGGRDAFLAVDPVRGGLWLGFAQGGVSYFQEGRVRESYSSAQGLGEGAVTSLYIDDNRTLWVSTGGGLSRVQNGRIATLNNNNGLPCNSIHWAIEDKAHSLWLYTACGLVQIARPELDAWVASVDKNPSRKIQVSVFDNSDGVPIHFGHSGYSPLVAESTDGRLWFATFEGVGVIDPRQILFNPLPPPVYIEQAIVDRKTYEATSQLRLPPLLRDLQIDFTALSLTRPEKVRFRYKLDGRDHDWQDAGNRRQAFYNDLPPGSYRFRLKASNNSGVWNEAGASWAFSIAPAYYQTIWFRLGCASVLATLLWCLYWLRLRRIALQFNMRMEERVSERTRIAGELHDTLLQSFQGLMLRFQTAEELLPAHPLEAKQALEGALERADEAIREGRNAVHDLRSSARVSNDLVQAVTAIGEEFAANGENARFQMVVEGTPHDLHPILRDEIYRIAREALWNAFRHAQARLIEAEITYSSSALRLRVRDDGVGIDSIVLDRGGRDGHWGLLGIRERAKRSGGQLDIWSRPGAGTEVELRIPGSIAYELSSAPSSTWSFRNKDRTSV